jgi:hypothetical protein
MIFRLITALPQRDSVAADPLASGTPEIGPASGVVSSGSQWPLFKAWASQAQQILGMARNHPTRRFGPAALNAEFAP